MIGLFLVGLLVNFSHGFYIQAGGCQLQLEAKQSEVVVADAVTLEPIYPQSSSLDVSIAADQTIVLGCAGGTLTYGKSTGTSIKAKCVSGSTFIVDNKEITLDPVKCSQYSYHTARYTGKDCEANGKEIEIGFALDDSTFVRIIQICFDDAQKTPLYSKYNLTSLIGSYQSGVNRPSFIEDADFYGLDEKVNTLYTNSVQRETINSLVGLPSSSTKYVQSSSDYFLSRGHLTAKADFVYGTFQRATFHYCNAAPQWQTFNGANWNSVEDSVRNYGEKNNLDLEVYTGTYGVATLPHEETKEEIPLYLGKDKNNNNVLPVPELYWKLVYNRNTGENIIILGANNPYKDTITPLCNDVTEKASWISWDDTNQKKGLSYACNAAELKGVIKQLPDLQFADLLV